MFLAQTSGGGSPIVLLLLLGMPVMLFWMMRSQRKKAAQQQDLQSSAGIGSEIMTTAGIFGTIVDEDEDEGTIILEIAPGTHAEISDPDPETLEITLRLTAISVGAVPTRFRRIHTG